MSSQIIEFSQNSITISKSKPFLLEITNKSKAQNMVFKIKTTRLSTYEVKPPFGSIQPGDKKKVQFKLVKPLSDEQLEDFANKDKFQLQFLLVSSTAAPKSKEQYKNLWNQEKSDPSKQGNFVNFTFPIQLDGERQFKTAHDEPFSPIKPKNSLLKSENKISNVKKSFTLQNDPQNDQRMSRQFEKLKEKQQQLVEEREKIFKTQTKTPEQKGIKGGVQIVLLILVFLLSVMIGNFLKLRVFVQEQL